MLRDSSGHVWPADTKVRLEDAATGFRVTGVLVDIFPANLVPDPEKIRKYDAGEWSRRTVAARVDRVVVRKDNGHFAIAPIKMMRSENED
jgi:Txe/YoeB family toxin of Txe-Axe toxin-antitoxin module